MKKLFTLALSFGLLSSVFAQSGHETVVVSPSKTVIVTHRGDTRLENDRSSQIKKINWEFDNKIAAVQRDRHLRNGEKNRQIRILEKQRQQQIAMVNDRFAHAGRRY